MKKIILFVTLLLITNSIAIAAKPNQLEFVCPFDTYADLSRFEELSKNKFDYYSASFGYFQYGSPTLHEKLRSNFKKLNLLSEKTPLIMGDAASGNLSVYYCKTKKCEKEEILYWSHKQCHKELKTDRCFFYAIRSKNVYYCVWGKGVNNKQ